MARRAAIRCEFKSLTEAATHFAQFNGLTTSAAQIKPLHWYVACRLVIEGGFRPEEVFPRPPLKYTRHPTRGMILELAPDEATGSELKVLGGLKTKNVDIVVAKENIGPVLAISCKGMIGALRNLTNRMEEFVGECTNLHIAYPALVLGFVFLLRAYRAADLGTPMRGRTNSKTPPRSILPNDLAFTAEGVITQSLKRLEYVLTQLSGRRGIRDDLSKYEAMALALVEPTGPELGAINLQHPNLDLRIERFFQRLYEQYDERFVYAAPGLKGKTARLGWAEDSPAFAHWDAVAFGYEPRIYAEDIEDEEEPDENG